MTLPTQARTVIIGGGVIGCSIAYHLAREGRKDIVVLERSKLTSGTTWHAAGLVRRLRPSATLTKLINYSIDLYGELEVETGQATGWTQTGSLTLATNEDRLTNIKRQVSLGRAFGLEAEVVDAARATVLHDPPPAASLPKRLQRLCAFANAPTDGRLFVHPVIRAVLLHFMLGYDHPFVDGNGRTARALFYWSMARSGYWLMEYVSISRLLRRAPAKYIRAYLHTETDANDATYFIVHQLEIIERAIEELHRYLEHKAAEQRGVEALLRHAPRLSGCLNHRQIALLGHALRHTGYAYTVESHRRSHRVTPQTARVDLQNLVHLKLLEQTKRSRAFRFYAPDDLRERIAGAAGLDGEDERCG